MSLKVHRLFICKVVLLLMAITLAPFTGSALVSADGGKPEIKLRIAPEQSSNNGETAFIVTVKDANHQPIANASVSLAAQHKAQQSGGHGAGHYSSLKVNAQAKPGSRAGEYLASLKLSADGDWLITVLRDRDKSEFTVDVNRGSAKVTAGNTAVKSSASTGVASMEAIHASYLDLSANMSDLRSRVTQWENGDEGSQRIAEEKLERIEIVLASIVWPVEMADAIDKVGVAVEPMARALNAKNVAAAQSASKTFGDASHDVTHAFYGDWLPALENVSFGPMAPYAIYMDINNNVSDLRSRVAQWEKGDESSMNIAKEKAERLGLLVPHMSSTGALIKPAQGIEKGLPAVLAAIEKKDVAETQKALKPITDGSSDLTRGFISWMDIMAGGMRTVCVQAAYLDLSANISQLRTNVDGWQKGDEGSLKIAQEKLERIQLILRHAEWPAEMAAATGKTGAAIELVSKALNTKDKAITEAALKDLGDASHDVTHAYYGDWLPGAQLASAPSVTQASAQHGNASPVPNYWFVGSMIGIVFMTIAMVPILRKRDAGGRGLGVSGT